MTIRTLTATGLAAALLTGCGSTASHPDAKPLTCRQQYARWAHGPATRALVSSLGAITRAMNEQDVPRTVTALKDAAATAGTALADKPPRCADPRGYWASITVLIRSAGDDATAARGMAAVDLAEGPLHAVVPLEDRLSAELRRTVGPGY